MKPKLDWEAVLIAIVGIMVFFILMIGAEKAVGAPRALPATPEEVACVNFIAAYAAYQAVPAGDPKEKVALTAISIMGMKELAVEGATAMDNGIRAGDVLPAMYKECLARKGQGAI